MKMSILSEQRQTALLQGLRDMRRDPARTPPLLERTPLETIQVPTVELLETVLSFAELRRLLKSPAELLTRRFTRGRTLVFDQAENAIGSLGYIRDSQENIRHFTEGGAAPIAGGLIAVEKFEEETGSEFEVRLVTLGEVLLHFLVLIPQPPSLEIRFLPLAPSFGRFDAASDPMTLATFRGLIERLIEELEATAGTPVEE